LDNRCAPDLRDIPLCVFKLIDMTESFRLLSEVFRNVFDDDALVLSRETTAKDIPQWDSLMHVALIINVEKTFDIRFSSSEVAGMQSLGELADLIDSKRKS
jgi:acyl carrier protein